MKSDKVVYIKQIEDVEKCKKRIIFETGISCVLYRSEIKSCDLLKEVLFAGSQEDFVISQELYEHILYEIVAKRAKKRVLYLLEKMDRTEYQIREKLKVNEYPECCIDIAVEYAKSFHYIDDYRYASTFVRYHMQKYSRMQMKQKLLAKGIARDTIEQAIESEYISEEREQIQAILQKKKFQFTSSNTPEFRKMYQFLLRRGFCSSDILAELKRCDTLIE